MDYESQLQPLGSFSSVQEFWALYSHIHGPNELPKDTTLHVFKQGIKPVWEDTSNKSGGKCVARLPKGLSARGWEALVRT